MKFSIGEREVTLNKGNPEVRNLKAFGEIITHIRKDGINIIKQGKITIYSILREGETDNLSLGFKVAFWRFMRAKAKITKHEAKKQMFDATDLYLASRKKLNYAEQQYNKTMEEVKQFCEKENNIGNKGT